MERLLTGREEAEALAYLAAHDAPCPACGYNLRSINRMICPECGTPVTWPLIVPAEPVRRPIPLALGWIPPAAVFAATFLPAAAGVMGMARPKWVVLGAAAMVHLVAWIALHKRIQRMAPELAMSLIAAVWVVWPGILAAAWWTTW